MFKENKEDFILKMVILSHISKESEVTAFNELFHLASLEMFAGKPQIKPHALLVCCLGNVLA